MAPPTDLNEAIVNAMADPDPGAALAAVRASLEKGHVSVGDAFWEDVLFSPLLLERHAALLEPFLDLSVRLGQSPWSPSSGIHGRSAYAWVVEESASHPFLDWCWGLPEAPVPTEPTIALQCRSDRLRGILGEAASCFSLRDEVRQNGFPLSERWASGQTTFHRQADALAVPPARFIKDFEWTDLQRQFRQMVREGREQGVGEDVFHVLTPAFWAAARAWEQVQAVRRFSRDTASPPWAASLRNLLKDLAPQAKGKKGTAGEGWQAWVDWRARTPFETAADLGAFAAGVKLMADLFPGEVSPAQRRHAWAVLMEGLEHFGLERFRDMGADPLLKPLTWPWDEATRIQPDPDRLVLPVWQAMLPMFLSHGPRLGVPAPADWERTVAQATRGQALEWPSTPFWMGVIREWSWDDRILRSVTFAYDLDTNILPAAAPSTRSRPRM